MAIVINFIKNNWLMLAITGIISSVYISCVTPGLTWSGFDCDLGDFLYAAKYGSVLHFPGFPVYSMLSWLAVRIPIGTDSFRLALFMSTLPAIITCVLVYFAVKKQTTNKFAPYVGMLSIAGANIFMMQAIIPEVYSFSVLMITASYTFMVYGKYRLAAIFGGFTFAMHWIAAPAVAGFVILNKDFRRKWKYLISAFLIPYIYVLVMGLTHPSFSVSEESTYGLLQYVIATLRDNTQWWLSLPIWQVPQKIGETIALLCVAFGLSLIPMMKYLFDWRKSKIILVAIVIPLLYFFGCVTGVAIVHVVLAAPFLAIAAGLGVDKLKIINPKYICVVSMILLCILPVNYDIGKTLDSKMSTEAIYNSFDNIDDGDIVVNLARMDVGGNKVISGRDHTLLVMYNRENDRNIISISMGGYCGIFGNSIHDDQFAQSYRDKLHDEYGIATPFVGDKNLSVSDLCWNIVGMISDANPDRDIYYTLLHSDDPFARELIKYEE
jgi:hypothetical protein